MDKREIWAQKHTKCCICQPIDTQAQNINLHLLETMQNRLEIDGKKKYEEIDQSQHIVEFPQLMKMIYKRKYKSHQITKKCGHQNLKKKFISQLKCTERQFNHLTNSFSWKLAKYNFHVDTISQQCKTFTRHIIQIGSTNKKRPFEKNNAYQISKEKNQQRQDAERGQRQVRKTNQNKDFQKSQLLSMKNQKQNTQKSTRQIRQQKNFMLQEAFSQKNKRITQKISNQKQIPPLITPSFYNQNIMKARQPQSLGFTQKQYQYPYYYNHYPRPAPPSMPYPDPMYYYHQQHYRRMYDPAPYYLPTMMDFSQFGTTQEKQKQKDKNLNLNLNSNLKVESKINYNKLSQGLDSRDNGTKSPLTKPYPFNQRPY